ncbi:MAG: DUF1987 domain-containing protein [Bacteroidales bacterium]|jgi:hypothetical protein|nr:DUF1987 domain-containing protein [Bacteroidales bacterium]
MESIRIEKTQKAPLFFLKDGYIRLSGRSIPQNAKQLYKICFDWVEQYVQTPARDTKVDLYFEYIDTSSIRCVVDILTKLDRIPEYGGCRVEINWYYEKDDEDSFDLGTYMQAHLKVPFNIIAIDEGGDIPAPLPTTGSTL